MVNYCHLYCRDFQVIIDLENGNCTLVLRINILMSPAHLLNQQYIISSFPHKLKLCHGLSNLTLLENGRFFFSFKNSFGNG